MSFQGYIFISLIFVRCPWLDYHSAKRNRQKTRLRPFRLTYFIFWHVCDFHLTARTKAKAKSNSLWPILQLTRWASHPPMLVHGRGTIGCQPWYNAGLYLSDPSCSSLCELKSSVSLLIGPWLFTMWSLNTTNTCILHMYWDSCLVTLDSCPCGSF